MTSVSAIIVTRGDVNMSPVLDSLPEEWEVLAWENGAGEVRRWADPSERVDNIAVSDLSVYGRYAAIEHASHDLIYVQDDDCIVSNPRALVHPILAAWDADPPPDFVVCNMPQEFRHSFYEEHALVGFGAAFHRDAPARAFARYECFLGGDVSMLIPKEREVFYRTCDIMFTALTPRVLVDVPKTNLWWAEDETRMYRQREHGAERSRMLELVKAVRAKEEIF